MLNELDHGFVRTRHHRVLVAVKVRALAELLEQSLGALVKMIGNLRHLHHSTLALRTPHLLRCRKSFVKRPDTPILTTASPLGARLLLVGNTPNVFMTALEFELPTPTKLIILELGFDDPSKRVFSVSGHPSLLPTLFMKSA